MPSAPKKNHLRLTILILLAILLVLAGLLLPSFVRYRLRSIPVERESQRQQVLQRIQAAGGWDALQKACATMVQANPDRPIQWINRINSPTELPSAILALQPKDVTFYPQDPFTAKINGTNTPVIHIRIFGIHSTGGHSQPYYGLEVICGPRDENYKPGAAATDAGYLNKEYRKITDHIYQIF